MQDINVSIFKRSNSRFFQARWIDPETGSQKWKSTKTIIRRDAERFVARLEKELRDGTYAEPSRTKWADFRVRYETEAVPGLVDRTGDKIRTTFNAVERVINPTMLSQVNTNSLSRLVKRLRDAGRAETTIRTYLAYIHAALVWGFERRLIPVVPTMPKIKRAKKSKMMKGRPITGEEFERMLDKVSQIVGEDRASSWQFFLWGLWLSGLRLDESLELWWDRADRLSFDVQRTVPDATDCCGI